MKRRGIAILGCGWTAGSQVENGFARLPERFALVACADLDRAKAEAFATRHGFARSAGSLDELLGLPEVEVVSICTPPAHHFDAVTQVLAAGRDVICEKPFVASLDQWARVRDAETAARGRVMPIFQYRFGDGIARIRRAIEAGLAGRGYVHSIETAWKRGADYYATPWRGKFATELGGVLLTQSIHMHDLLYFLVGPASRVAAFKATRVNPIEVEDCAVASLSMRDGSLASLTATLGSALQTTRLRLCFEHGTFERIETEDRVGRIADDPWTVIPAATPAGERLAEACRPDGAAPGQRGFARQFELFAEALDTGGPFPVTLDDARNALELITAIFQSAETGVVEALPITPDHPRWSGWITETSRTTRAA